MKKQLDKSKHCNFTPFVIISFYLIHIFLRQYNHPRKIPMQLDLRVARA